jgi:CBS domain-containing protein
MKNFRKHLILSGSSIKEALIKLDLLSLDAIIFITDHEDHLIGSLTDGDVRRALIKDIPINSIVDDIIQPAPRFIRKGERDIQKIIEYRDNNFRILPILSLMAPTFILHHIR